MVLWALNAIIPILIGEKQREVDTDLHRGEGPMKTVAENGELQSQAREH